MEADYMQPMPEPLMDTATENRKAQERARLKEDYERWRKEPFTELFLSYFHAWSQMHRDMCVLPGTADRDKHAHYHEAYRRVATMSDDIYLTADANIERRYYHEAQERNREIYGPDGEGDSPDVWGPGDDRERTPGL